MPLVPESNKKWNYIFITAGIFMIIYVMNMQLFILLWFPAFYAFVFEEGSYSFFEFVVKENTIWFVGNSSHPRVVI